MDEQTNASGETIIETPDPSATPDPLKNFKAEMDRKHDNLTSAVSQLTETNKALAAQLAAMKVPQPQPQPTDSRSLREKFYENEDATLNEIQEKATRSALEIVQKQNDIERRRQSVLSAMITDYPELTEQGSELRKKAESIYATLTPEEKADPNSYKMVIRDAAADLGVVPKSKRKADPVADEDDDSFQLNGGQSNNGIRNANKRGKKESVSEETLLFAQLLGRPVDDPKYRERLEKANKRDNWKKYRKVGG